MARKRRKSSPSHSRNNPSLRVVARRDTFPIANRRLPRLIALSGEDHRRFHPMRENRPLKRLDGSPAFLRLRLRTFRNLKRVRNLALRPRRRSMDRLQVELAIPRDAVICARRRVRKSVLFAKRKAGRGGQRPPRRNFNSQIVCR